MNQEQLVKIVEKRWKRHKEDVSPEGDATCPITDYWGMRIAPKEQWLGDETSWKEAMREQKQQDKIWQKYGNKNCDFCWLCEELLKDYKRCKKCKSFLADVREYVNNKSVRRLACFECGATYRK